MLEVIDVEPQDSHYTPLSEHQAETPDSFFGANPILHYKSVAASVLVPRHDSPFTCLKPRRSSDRTELADLPSTEDSHLLTLDIWITSEHLTVWSQAERRGLNFEYPDIELHALKILLLPGSDERRRGVYLQISSPAQQQEQGEDDSDADTNMIEITIVPTDIPAPPNVRSHTGDGADGLGNSEQEKLFQALTYCQNLHPDRVQEGDYGYGDDSYIHEGDAERIDWITAENVGQSVDADGQWSEDPATSSSDPLGPGAGRVRNRDEVEQEDEVLNHVNGGDTPPKWQRTG